MTLDDFLRQRGIRDPRDACPTCKGFGTRTYSNTSGWRGGMGGCAMTADVCDVCWGSGDTHRPGEDLRALHAARVAWEAAQVLEYLDRLLGANYRTTGPYVDRLADLCEAQTKKRKLPEGVDAFWWNRTWEMFANVLRKLRKRAGE